MALQPTLSTPLEIHTAVTAYFRCPRLWRVREQPLEVDLRLAPQIPTIRLTNALSRQLFLTALWELAKERAVARQNGVRFVAEPLDPSHFSVQAPLTCWYQFQRFLHEQEGNRCKDAIRSYLQSPETEPVPEALTMLGLAPNQAEEEDAPYFKEAIQGLKMTDPAVAHLRARYPAITRRLAEEIARQELARPLEDEYAKMVACLQKLVIGQEFATRSMASVLARLKADENSVYLFVGPTGIGKTSLAKAVAKLKEDRFIAFHMNQYTEAHTVSTFFGSPAGYVGSVSKPQLALELERYPKALTWSGNKCTVRNVLMLFDEFEKAHPTLRQSLLTLFDEGHCTIRYTPGGYTNTVLEYELKGCILINTSNLCHGEIITAFQQGCSTEEIVEVFKQGNRALQQIPFAPSYSNELLGRLRIIPFGPVPRGEPYQKALQGKLHEFMKKVREELPFREIEVEDEPFFLRLLEERLYGEGVDLRRGQFYFDNVRNLVYQNKRLWGDIKNKKMTLCSVLEHGELQIRLSTYVELAGAYVPTPVAPLII